MKSIFKAAACAALLLAASKADAALSPVAANGQLRVVGNYLVNQRGDTVQLRGVATHGLQWFHSFYDGGKSLTAAAEEWGVDVLRITLYLTEGGYLTSTTLSKEDFEAMIDEYITLCVQKGMYAIIDWHVHHPGYPGYYLKDAKPFFTKMAAKYAKLPNVLWEICNEPSAHGLDSVAAGHYVEWSEIALYANEVIPLIREHNSEAVVLVGTPSWSTLGISTKGNNGWQEIADNKAVSINNIYNCF